MMKGLPGSGKSTIAKAMVDELDYVRTNKDELRLEHPNWDEVKIVHERNRQVRTAFDNKKSVVVDDTNFNPVHKKYLQKLCKDYGVQFEEVFVDTPLEECIKRDNARANGVGETVIKRMYRQYLRKIETPIKLDTDEDACIIVDIDGTLAHMTEEGRLRFGRQAPYMWKNVGEDKADLAVQTTLVGIQLFGKTVAQIMEAIERKGRLKTILMSGRDEVCRPETEKWLKDNGIQYDELFMRPQGDNRKDNLVKEEIYEREINGKYEVLLVLDDRDQVVEMWRNKGLKCFQVAEGDF